MIMAKLSPEYKEDKKHTKKINSTLKLISIDDYDLNEKYEYDPNLSRDENIARKYVLKKKARDLKDATEYDLAILHNLYLLKNSYFINDYYPYRYLAINYESNNQLEEMTEIIKCFFKSGIYAHDRHINWFIYKLISLEKENYITNDEIDSLVNYYNSHGALNKHKEHDPIFLADRIFQRTNGDIKLEDQWGYEKQQEKYALKEEGAYLERLELYDQAIDFYTEIIEANANGATEAFKRLAYIYEMQGKYDKEIEILNQFYQKKYKIVGKNTKDEFKKRIKNLNKSTGSSYTEEDFISGNVEVSDEIKNKSRPTNTSYKKLSNDELLFKYAELYEKGLITREEFDKKKQELLKF